jgi:hypothetical protein
MSTKSKFSLVTLLTLNTAGYNNGINAAKKNNKQLQQSVGQMSTGLKSQFGQLSSLTGGLGVQFVGLITTLKGSSGVFSMMKIGINGVSKALIASGIGAIFVAVGVAMAALISYLKGTREGSEKLQTVLTFLKGGFQAILVRVQLLGEAISLLFSGKFKEAGEKMKEAFAGGLLDDIKKKANENVEIQKRQIALDERKLKFGYAEIDQQEKISQLRADAKDSEEFTANQRIKFLREAEKLEIGLATERYKIAEEEHKMLVERNALGNNTLEDDQAELDAYIKKKNELVAMNNLIKGINTEKKRLLSEAGKEYDFALKGPDMNFADNSDMVDFKLIDDSEVEKAIESVNAYHANMLAQNDLTLTNQQSFVERMSEINNQMGASYANLGEAIANVIQSSMQRLSSNLSEGSRNFKEYAKNVRSSSRDIIQSFIAQAVASAVANAIKSTAKLGPIGLALIPVIAAGAAGLANTAMNTLIPKFQYGGIVGGVGGIDSQVVRATPGEMFLNFGQQKNLFDIINSGRQGVGNRQLVAQVSGDNLNFVLQEYQRKRGNTI